MTSGSLRSRRVMANGVNTHYTEAGGDAAVIIALHGGGAGSSGESGMGLVMPHLASDFRVIAPDSVGGYGDTDPYAPIPQGLVNRVTHLEDFVDVLCLDKFTLTGNSQGAWAAVRYASLHPDRVEKLILISSLTIAQGLGIDQAPTPAMNALMGYDGTREGMRKLLDALIIDKSRITDALIDRRQKSATRPGAMEAAKSFAKNTAALRSNPVLALQLDLRVTLPTVAKQIPTMMIWGELDTFAVKETGLAVEKAVPGMKFQWLTGAGHQVQTDKPEESAEIIGNFVRG
jgi:2-hydroxy-6-oxonona-2,4-dienedioate hydrolase